MVAKEEVRLTQKVPALGVNFLFVVTDLLWCFVLDHEM